MTNRQKQFIDGHNRFVRDNGRIPTIKEFAHEMNCSYTVAQKRAKQLDLECIHIKPGCKEGISTWEVNRTVSSLHCPECEEVRDDRYPYFVQGRLKMICGDCVRHFETRKKFEKIIYHSNYEQKNEINHRDPMAYPIKIARLL